MPLFAVIDWVKRFRHTKDENGKRERRQQARSAFGKPDSVGAILRRNLCPGKVASFVSGGFFDRTQYGTDRAF